MSVFKLVSLDALKQQLGEEREHHHHSHGHKHHHRSHHEQEEDLQLQNLDVVPGQGYDPFCELDNSCDPQWLPKRHSEDYEPIPDSE